jgi:Reverse transcriptase (RNA-dependent DNA polymerase)
MAQCILVNIVSKNTFEKTTNYKGEICLPVCAVFRTKIKADGTVDKLKVRIAIRGDLDQGAKDEDNSAPLATFRLLKVFLAEAAWLRRRVYQADFIGAYLQAKMDRLVYVILPKEYAIYFPDLAHWFGIPLILRKSAYGINSAGRLWAKELFGWYIEFGFTQSAVEPSLFKYKKGNKWIILVSYCDNTAYFASSDEMRKHFEKSLCQRFDCKLLGQLHWFLQAQIT